MAPHWSNGPNKHESHSISICGKNPQKVFGAGYLGSIPSPPATFQSKGRIRQRGEDLCGLP